MARTVSAAAGKPGAEEPLLAIQADAEGWYGQAEKRSRTDRAGDGFSGCITTRRRRPRAYQAEAALREVESGYREQARAEAEAAAKLAKDRDVWVIAALALARAGDTAGAEKLAAELDKTFPAGYAGPEVLAAHDSGGGRPASKDPDRAIELLKVVIPVELGGQPMLRRYLSPAYVARRGLSHAARRQPGGSGISEVHRPSRTGGDLLLGCAGPAGTGAAYTLQGDTAKARAAYRDFLTLWKRRRPRHPHPEGAKAEYAKAAITGRTLRLNGETARTHARGFLLFHAAHIGPARAAI